MASEIHEIEIARRLSSGTHLFIPPLVWNLATVGSAAHLVNLIQQSGRDAKIVAHPDWVDCIPESWPESLFIFPEELKYEFQDRPQWAWLWGLGHTKQHSQELNHFLLGLDSIQILDWTNDRVRRRGQYYHDCGYLGGLTELSFVLSRDLWPVYNWNSTCLGDALRFYMQQYPMTCLDAPMIHMAGQLDLSPLETPTLPELAELRRHETWTIQVYKNLSLPQKQALQLHGLNLYQKDSSQNLLLVLEDHLGRSDFQVLTPHVDLELKLRKCLQDSIDKHNLGGFEVLEVDALLAALEKALELSSKEIKKVKPWPTINFSGDHPGFACHDPQWEIERDNRLHADEVIEEEEPEEEEDEEVNETLDWDANLLIHRLKHLKLPTLKLTRKDLVVAHLPVLRLEDQDLKATQDRLIAEREAEIQRKKQAILDAREEQERLERERLEAERRLQEIEAEKLRQAEAAQAQVEAERLADEERQAQEALAAEQDRIEAEQKAKDEAEQEQEKARREAPQDDYLHTDKQGWGAEDEKDESEELLESFQQIDRDHPIEDNEHYDDEEKLDDSMGIEHPSYEMFEEKEDESVATAQSMEDENDQDLEPEALIEELDIEEEPESVLQQELEPEEDEESEEICLSPEEIMGQLDEPVEIAANPVEEVPVESDLENSEVVELVEEAEEESDSVEPEEDEESEEIVDQLDEPVEIAANPVEEVPVESDLENPEVVELVEEAEEEPDSVEPEEDKESKEVCLSPEEIMDQLDEHIEMVDLDPSTVIEDEAEPIAHPGDQASAAEPVEEVERDLQNAEVEEEFSENQTEEEIEFEPEAADVTKAYINKAEFEAEDEDGAVYEFHLDETFLEDEETTKLSKLEVVVEPDVKPLPEPETQVSGSVQTKKVIGRETKTGYVNPYLWDHHHRVNDLLEEVRQEKRLRKSDLAYVAIVAVVLVWAHLNQLPFI